MTNTLWIGLAFVCLSCKTEVPPATAVPDAEVIKKVIVPVRKPQPPDAARALDAPAQKPLDAAPPAQKPVDVPASNGPVGVAPCDEYLAKMAKCIKRLGPEAAEPMKNAMSESTTAWQSNARTPEGKAALVDTCRQALDAARSAAAAMGCDW